MGLILAVVPYTTVHAYTCCCAQFTFEECESVHDTTRGHCVWRQRPSYGPSTGEKGICRTERWLAIQQDSDTHHPRHTTAAPDTTTTMIKLLAEDLDNNDVENPTVFNWPQICFEQGSALACNQPPTEHEEEYVAAVSVEVGESVHDTQGHVMSLGVISTMVAIITFFGTMIGFCLYSLYRKLQCVKEANEGILDTNYTASSYSTFPSV